MAQELIIRHTTDDDLDTLMEIYHEAQDFMIANGNPTQWGHFNPKREMLVEDIKNQTGYAVIRKEETDQGVLEIISGTFAFILGEDPTYLKIEGGAWLNQEPYGTIHRIASRTNEHGVFNAAIEFAKTKTQNIRIDTHRDNAPMKHLIEKAGFTYCGIIYIADGTPRIAYQKALKANGGNMKIQTYIAEDASLDPAMAFLESEMEANDVPVKIAMQIAVAFEELFVNVAHYAYPEKVGQVEVGINIENQLLTFTLKDSGIPFDPLAKEDPDITLKVEDRKIGGLGIYMVKKTMDSVTYKYEDGMNQLTVTKSF